ncbi:dihydrodipicolinate synthase/N-acetylneuraminate lyase [Bradyrhizobium sp. LM6.10]
MFIPPSAWFTGFIPDVPTPFDAADAIDIEAFAALCERQVAVGVAALVICETVGEAPTLSPAEQELVIRTAVDVVRGRARIIAGAMSNATGHAIELARRAEAAGARCHHVGRARL